MSLRLLATGILVTAALMASPGAAAAQSPPDVQIFAPSFYETAESDESVRFSWWPENSQDFFRVVFSEYRTLGWETSPYSTRETVLNSIYASPEDVGLTPGIWYWRVCFGWYDDPGTCYLDDDIRTLDVEEAAPFLSLFQARSTARRQIRRRFGVRASIRCARVNRSEALCRADWRRKGRQRTRFVDVEARSDGIYFSIRTP